MCLLTALLFAFLIASFKYFVSPITANKSPGVTLTPVHGVFHSGGHSGVWHMGDSVGRGDTELSKCATSATRQACAPLWQHQSFLLTPSLTPTWSHFNSWRGDEWWIRYPFQHNPECRHAYHSKFLVIRCQAPNIRRKNLQHNISRVKKKKKNQPVSSADEEKIGCLNSPKAAFNFLSSYL